MAITAFGVHANITVAEAQKILGIVQGSGAVQVPIAVLKARYTNLLHSALLGHHGYVSFGLEFPSGDGLWTDDVVPSTAQMDCWLSTDMPEANLKAMLQYPPGGSGNVLRPTSWMVRHMTRVINSIGVTIPGSIALIEYGTPDDYVGSQIV